MYARLYRTAIALTLTLPLLPGLASSSVVEGGSSPTLPATFVPVKSEAWLEQGEPLTIGVMAGANQQLYLAEAKVSGNFLVATQTNPDADGSLTVTDEALLWTLERSGENVLLAHGGKYVGKGKSATQIKLTTNRAEAIAYRIAVQSDGTFTLAVASEEGRNFVLDYATNGIDYTVVHFGNYKDAGTYSHLRLYRYAKATLHIDGEAQMPDDGASVTFYSNGFAPSPDGAVGTAEFLLTDGTLAPAISASRWTTELHDASTLAFFNTEGLYLSADMQPTPQPTWWTLRDGALWQGERVLRFDAARRRFVSLPAEEATDAHIKGVEIISVADDPQTALADGILKASGGFSASQLASIDWQDAYMLDLTAVALPVAAHSFEHRPEQGNTIVAVSESSAASVPAEWDFTVSRGATNRLLTTARLTDRVPLRLPSDIIIGSGQVVYERTLAGDGGWETLALPFAAGIPDGFIVEEVSETDAEAVYFAQANTIRGGHSVLIRPRNSGVSQVKFVSDSGTLSVETTGPLRGTFEGLTVQSSSPTPLFFLNSDATAFVRAATGSQLAPFRAAFAADGTRSIRHQQPIRKFKTQ